MMKTLDESGLEEALSAFTTELAKFVCNSNGAPSPAHLILDNRKISAKADLTSTNGRYFFRNPDEYRRYYIPHAESPGVYLFFDEAGSALYVGKSETAGGIGRRVASHIERFDGDSLPYLAFPEAQYVVVIPFVQAPWLAPAFESYLLSKNTFQYNVSLAERERYAAGAI